MLAKMLKYSRGMFRRQWDIVFNIQVLISASRLSVGADGFGSHLLPYGYSWRTKMLKINVLFLTSSSWTERWLVSTQWLVFLSLKFESTGVWGWLLCCQVLSSVWNDFTTSSLPVLQHHLWLPCKNEHPRCPPSTVLGFLIFFFFVKTLGKWYTTKVNSPFLVL